MRVSHRALAYYVGRGSASVPSDQFRRPLHPTTIFHFSISGRAVLNFYFGTNYSKAAQATHYNFPLFDFGQSRT